ncbi:MAG: T9SS type A sorting domain-containing protein [Saprospiraceae bacterium]|nr:T9SS type A sorting domain-containing protein [Saprospiraceae bacterium]
MKIPSTQISPIPKWLCNIKSITFMYLVLVLQLQASPEDWPVYEDIPHLGLVKVEEAPLPCFGSVQVSLAFNGRAVLTAKMFISDPTISVSAMKVEVLETGRNYVDCNDIGKSRSAKVRDTLTNNSCWAVITVEDKLMPPLLCENDTFQCTTDPFDIRYETLIDVEDNCDDNPTIYYGLNFQKLNCHVMISSIMHVNYIVKDKNGNSATCVKDVVFKKLPLDSIQFPADDTVYCTAPGNSGVPGYNGEPVSAMCDLIASRLDDTIPVCGGMYKINRRWTVMDWCLRISKTQMQEILVSDTGRPVIICPPDSSLVLQGQNCIANYTLPSINATDGCAPSELLYYLIRVDSLYTARPGETVSLTEGTHTLDYIAFDPCGNADTCSRKIDVQDKSAPSLVCPSKLVISLGANGEVKVDISYLEKFIFYTDNCGVTDIFIRRVTNRCARPQDTIYRRDVTFCCLDLGSTEMLMVKVVDQWGNSNLCMIPMEIQNKLVTLVNCPADRNLQCDQDTSVNFTGKPKVTNVCTNLSFVITHSDSGTLDSCRAGIIKRKFFIQYSDGTIDSSCLQTINVVNTVSVLQIEWPRDTLIAGCTSNDPNDLGQEPLVLNFTCRRIAFEYRDSIPVLPVDSCPRILRIWRSIPTCGLSEYRDTQTILLLDLNPPILKGPKDTFHCVEDTFCHPFINLPDLEISGCNTIVTVTNNFTNGGVNCSGIYPLGRHTVIFTVVDGCGHVVKDTVLIEIVDKISPSVSCRRLLRNIQANDSAKVTARDLVATFSDNCTPSGLLVFTFDPANLNDTCRFISCTMHKQFPDSLWPILVYVKDLSFNKASCIARVDVDDPSGFCNNLVGNKIGITGLIRSTTKEPHVNVPVNEMNEHKEAKTNYNGLFEMSGYKESDSIEIIPIYNEDWLSGVSTLDIVRIQKHILGVDPFTSPFEWLAADVNKDGRVSSQDISLVRKLILGTVTEVKGNTSYRFIPENYTFKDLEFPLNDDVEEVIQTDYLTTDFKANFTSIKVGDVSGALGNVNTSTLTRNRYYSIGTMDAILSDDVKGISTFSAEQDFTVEGYQLRILFDPDLGYPERLVEYSNSEQGSNMSEEQYSVVEDKLVISYTNQFPKRIHKGDKLFSIVWKSAKECKVSNIIRETAFNDNEVYASAYSKYPLIIHINDQQALSSTPEIENFKLAPNPFTEDCTISFISNMEVDSYLEVISSNGKIVLSKWVSILNGSNSIRIAKSELQGQGIYHYKYIIGNYIKKGKIVLTK